MDQSPTSHVPHSTVLKLVHLSRRVVMLGKDWQKYEIGQAPLVGVCRNSHRRVAHDMNKQTLHINTKLAMAVVHPLQLFSVCSSCSDCVT